MPVNGDPIEDGSVLVRSDKVEALDLRATLVRSFPDEPEIDFQNAVIMPGFVNTHSHLEYSVFGRAVEPSSFTSWILQLIKRSRQLSLEDWENSARLGASLSIKSGVTCLGDIVSRGPGFNVLCESGLRGIGFAEVIEMDTARNDDVMATLSQRVEGWQEQCAGSLVKVGVSPHSLYTVNPLLLERLGKWAKGHALPVSIHLAESREETAFVRDGRGGLVGEYREFLGWDHFPLRATGLTPVRYAEQLGALDGVIAAHCVQVNAEDMAVLKDRNVAVAHCPRSNSFLRVGNAPVADLLGHGISVGLGTDSLASNEDMGLLGEMKHIYLAKSKNKDSAQAFTPRKIIEAATLDGARALGMDDQIGSLEEYKEADLIALKLSVRITSPNELFEYCVREACKGSVIFNMVGGNILFHQRKSVGKDRV